MKTVCPSCGAIHSAEALFSDAEARQVVKIIADLPASVSRSALAYLAMFRGTSGRVLQWRRALTLLSELREMVSAAHVQRGGNVARPNRPEFWGEALGRIVAQPPARLPLKGHGYLAAMVYDIADQADRETEKEYHRTPVAREASAPGTAMSPERMREIRENSLIKAKAQTN